MDITYYQNNGILVATGYNHHKNRQGLHIGASKLNIPIYYINNFEESLKYVTPIIIIPSGSLDQFPLQNIPINKRVLYGPHGTWILPPQDMRWVGDLIIKNACYNMLCDWNIKAVEETVGNLIMNTVALPFGVDIDTFKPIDIIRKNKVLIYIKDRKIEDVDYIMNNVIPYLQLNNYEYCIYKYGNYNDTDLLNDSIICKFGIIIDRHESQGFAIQQMLACNLPLLVWDVNSLFDSDNNFSQWSNYNLYATTVPYWNNKCGEIIKNKEEIINTIPIFIENINSNKYNPREYIVNTLNPEKCLIDIINTLVNLKI